jgi:glutaredoxin 3
MATDVKMYRTRSCPFCIAAAEFLTARKIAFEEEFLDGHPDRRAFTAGILPGHHTVPLVVIGGRPIGGLDALQALDAQGRLTGLVTDSDNSDDGKDDQ